jgi:hypothetical protein
MTTKILEFFDKYDSVCSFWRGAGTNSELQRQGLIETKEANWNENWSTIRKYHIALFQRPVHKMCLDQALLCKDLGLKIWVDLDDWKNVPREHVMYNSYTDSFDELSFKKMLMLADVITVTNWRIASKYTGEYPFVAEKIDIIPNAINDLVYSFKPFSKEKRIVYRGGQNHVYDIKIYQDAIRQVLVDNPDWQFFSIGQDIRRLKSLPNYQYLGRFELHTYFGLICGLNPSIFVVPLKDNDFNRCKSNISWLEGTLSGAACLCPEYFKDTDSVQYDSVDSFKHGLENLISDKKLRAKMHAESIKTIESNYLLSKVNQVRMETINRLL